MTCSSNVRWDSLHKIFRLHKQESVGFVNFSSLFLDAKVPKIIIWLITTFFISELVDFECSIFLHCFRVLGILAVY